MFDEIVLEQEQKDLLTTLVEVSRSIPKNQRQKFLFIETGQKSWIQHSSLQEAIPAYIGDIEILAQGGLLNLSYSSKGTPNFDVAPRGYKYYEYLKKNTFDPIQTIEASSRGYIAGDWFQQEYPKAYQKWYEAEQILWSSDSERQLTMIGHLCREAMQEFVTRLVEKYNPSEIDTNKAHIVARARAILDYLGDKIGKTEIPFIEAFINYWGTVNDLIQRQEHGAQKEGQELVWEDGRRAIFQTLMVMLEFDKALLSV